MATSVPQLWPGDTFVCIGGGPSLTPEDVESVRGRARVIAINNAYLLAPWADVLYACDAKWWKYHSKDHESELSAFAGLKYALQPEATRWHRGVQVLKNTGREGIEASPTGLRTGRNSGYQAINLSVHLGASRILLLGYDMKIGPHGMRHWHPDHPDRMPSPYSAFVQLFSTSVKPLRDLGVDVINCTPRSALQCFPSMPLEDALKRIEVAA